MENGKVENPFMRANKMEKRIKMLIWGESGSGKTTLALQFPNPVVIDCEGGTELYGEKFDFDVIRTSDPERIMLAVDYLLRNTHKYKTLIIDPITIFWESLQKKWSDIFLSYSEKPENKAMKGYKGEFFDFQPKDWMTIKQDWKELLAKINALDMNIVVTARAKKEYEDNQFMKVKGETYDGEKSLSYLFDVVLQLYKENGKRMAFAKKDRSNSLPEDPFEVSYKIIQEKFGKEGLTREVKTIRTEIADSLFKPAESPKVEPVKTEAKPEPKTEPQTKRDSERPWHYTVFGASKTYDVDICPECGQHLRKVGAKTSKAGKPIPASYWCAPPAKGFEKSNGCGKNFNVDKIENDEYYLAPVSAANLAKINRLLEYKNLAVDTLAQLLGEPFEKENLKDLTAWKALEFIGKLQKITSTYQDQESERMGE